MASPNPTLLVPREDQREMFEQSMKQNVIVAMPTGSGKTLVAVLRIQEELKRCRQDQLIWFIAPTVVLCQQQYLLLERSFPGVGVRLLSGDLADKLWTNKKLWDAIMINTRVIVSTPAVLTDAVHTHAYIHVSKLALIVVDEAHRCVGKSRLNEFMQERYATTPSSQRPHILGLSASPAMKADLKSLLSVEKSLRAVTKSPRLHRLALEQVTNRPETRAVFYSDQSTTEAPQMLQRLAFAKESYDLQQDPYVLELKHRNALDELEKVMQRSKTFCTEQLKILLNRAIEVAKELGPDPAEDYIWSCKCKLEQVCAEKSSTLLDEWTAKEKSHLRNIITQVTGSSGPCTLKRARPVSDKLKQLLEVLNGHQSDTFTGIIFAKQRVVVSTLTSFLARHPSTKDKFQVGCFVGSSASVSKKTSIADLADVKGQQSMLEDFRQGKVNLIVATDVLEEGIDIPACNTIISFDSPAHLVSYVQRRGRARHRQSSCILFFPHSSERISAWEKLEEEMNAMYRDEKRMAEPDAEDDVQDEDDGRMLLSDSTSATMSMNSVVPHLQHFCQTLASDQMDHKARFTCVTDEKTNTKTAKVFLPSSVDPKLRTASCRHPWSTKKAAVQDAAFVAYEALYRAGLLNEHLLPVDAPDLDELDLLDVEAGKSVLTVADVVDPWSAFTSIWSDESRLFTREISLEAKGEPVIRLSMVLPSPVVVTQPFQCYWNESKTYTVRIEDRNAFDVSSSERKQQLQHATSALLSMVLGSMVIDRQKMLMACFVPDMPAEDLERWSTNVMERQSLQNPTRDLLSSRQNLGHHDNVRVRDLLIHNSAHFMAPYIAESICLAAPTRTYGLLKSGRTIVNQREEQLCVQAIRLPKRRDYLHVTKHRNDTPKKSPYTRETIPVDDCLITSVSSSLARATLFIPSILHVQEISMIAHEVRTNLLAAVDVQDNSLILTAISASSANEQSNYQRFEFLGDCLLKLCTTIQLMADYPQHPEAYLTRMKGRLVSNENLAKAALDLGLDRYIITKAFTGQKWRPIYVDDCITASDETTSTRQMSKKVLADVVEALIGAAYLDGVGVTADFEGGGDFNSQGLDKALKCIKLFLPKIKWFSLAQAHGKVFTQLVPTTSSNLSTFPYQNDLLIQPQTLLSHTFAHPALLLTALTHASHQPSPTSPHQHNYERLEFLGDALLDYIITDRLFAYRSPATNEELPHQTLHTLRTALANGHFLAFLCLRHAVEVDVFDVETSVVHPQASDSNYNSTYSRARRTLQHLPRKTTRTHNLHNYMQHDPLSDHLRHAISSTSSLFATHGAAISAALADPNERYPWLALQRLEAPKSISDIVESCVAAVWLDAMGGNGDEADHEQGGGGANGLKKGLEAVGQTLDAFGFSDMVETLLAKVDRGAKWGEEIKGRLLMHPKEEVGILSAGWGVEYVLTSDAGTTTTTSPSSSFITKPPNLDPNDDVSANATINKPPNTNKTTNTSTLLLHNHHAIAQIPNHELRGHNKYLKETALADAAVRGWDKAGGGAEVVKNLVAAAVRQREREKRRSGKEIETETETEAEMDGGVRVVDVKGGFAAHDDDDDDDDNDNDSDMKQIDNQDEEGDDQDEEEYEPAACAGAEMEAEMDMDMDCSQG